MGDRTPRRTAASIAARATKVDEARFAGQSKMAVNSLAQKEGMKGYSLLVAPFPEDTARYPALKYLWGLVPDLLPYDTMHLLCATLYPVYGGTVLVQMTSLATTSPVPFPRWSEKTFATRSKHVAVQCLLHWLAPCEIFRSIRALTSPLIECTSVEVSVKSSWPIEVPTTISRCS